MSVKPTYIVNGSMLQFLRMMTAFLAVPAAKEWPHGKPFPWKSARK